MQIGVLALLTISRKVWREKCVLRFASKPEALAQIVLVAFRNP
jgi:hypothetical protein